MVHMGPCTHVGDLDLFYFVERHKERSSNIKTGRNNSSIHRFNPQMEAKAKVGHEAEARSLELHLGGRGQSLQSSYAH